jgi:hypothetical protein
MEIMIELPFLRGEVVATKGATTNSTIETLKPCNGSNPLIHGFGSIAP